MSDCSICNDMYISQRPDKYLLHITQCDIYNKYVKNILKLFEVYNFSIAISPQAQLLLKKWNSKIGLLIYF